MMIILNPKSGGERAMERWDAFCGAIRDLELDRADVVLAMRTGIDEAVIEALRRGERRFVAAGGDGTVNALLNALMAHRHSPGFGDVALGAIGLGSSNDFHKTGGEHVPPVPAKIDFDRVRPQDVGCLAAAAGAGTIRRFFIVNASVGTTAEGNELFNRPSGPLAALKRLAPALAIPAAALTAIARHDNLEAWLSVDGDPERPVSLSNLSLFKNPHISGTMRIAADDAPDDGRLGLWMEEGLSKGELLGLFLRLATGRFVPGGRSTVRRCASLRIRARRPFPVEFDGEVLHTADAVFTVLQRAIGVCQ